jgi:hypothetical protein
MVKRHIKKRVKPLEFANYPGLAAKPLNRRMFSAGHARETRKGGLPAGLPHAL